MADDQSLGQDTVGSSQETSNQGASISFDTESDVAQPKSIAYSATACNASLIYEQQSE